jgi:hypothetical protein
LILRAHEHRVAKGKDLGCNLRPNHIHHSTIQTENLKFANNIPRRPSTSRKIQS